MTPRYLIHTANGSGVVGVVQGAGGPVSSIERIRKAIRQAEKGRDTGLYEPRPGVVIVYPEYSAAGLGTGVEVSLVGATVEEA